MQQFLIRMDDIIWAESKAIMIGVNPLVTLMRLL